MAYVEAGHSARAAGRVFGVSASTAVRLVAGWRSRATLAARPQGRAAGTVGKLAAHRAFLVEVVRAEPDITLRELAGVLLEAEGVRANFSSLHRVLKASGYAYKKGLIASERDRPALRRARADWARRQRFMRQVPHRLVFVDETSVRTDLTRLRGRAPRGQRLTGSAPFGRWHSQTFIAGLTCDGLIAPWVISGATDRQAFDVWIETQLAPILAPGSAFGPLTRTGGVRGLTPRQPVRPPQPPRRASPQGAGLMAPAAACLQPRSQPHRNGVLEAECSPQTDRSQNLRRRRRRPRHRLRSVHNGRMPQLHRSRRIRCRLNAKCFRILQKHLCIAPAFYFNATSTFDEPP